MYASEFRQLSALTSIDAGYRFGRPKVYLREIEIARLTLVRSRLGDTRAEREAESLPRAAWLAAPVRSLAPAADAPRSVPDGSVGSPADAPRRAATSRVRSTTACDGGR